MIMAQLTELIDLREVRSENLKILTDLGQNHIRLN